jgi:FkbM family methyltransferase
MYRSPFTVYQSAVRFHLCAPCGSPSSHREILTRLERLGIILAKLVPSGMLVPVLRGPLRGAKWIAGSAAGPAKGLSVVLNLTEPEQLEMARKLAHSGGICWDIGANVGLYTLLFSRHAKHVFAFEPLPRNIGYLTRTLEVNGVSNATIVPCAVSDSVGLAAFQEGTNCAEGRLDGKAGLPVAAISGDAFASAYGVVPSLIKIDVEGGELSVLKGAKKLLLSHKPTILLSTHGESRRVDCFGFLRSVGYAQFVPLNGDEIHWASEFLVMS